MTTTDTDHSVLPALGAAEAARLIANREITSREATEACLAQIARLNPALNAITHPREAALAEADAADARQAAGKPLGPLHGLPVTIKDCFAVAGSETTLGIPGFSPGPDQADSPLVRRLRAAGAVIVGKTNVPQGMLLHECENSLYGLTLHPTDAERSPGGSSGGEATAVAAGMSLLGLASDLGGSTRHPAHSCGLVGYKPTSGRLTIQGSKRTMPGMRSLIIQPGPICRTTADADLAMRVLVDPTAAPKQSDERNTPWPDYRDVDVAGLRVVYWTDNGVAAPCAAIRRAVEQSARHLADLGADVVGVSMPDPDEMLRVYFGLISADGLRSFGRLVKGRKKTGQVRRQLRLAKYPQSARNAIALGLSAFGQPGLAKLLRLTGPRSADQYWQLTSAADAYRTRFWEQLDGAFGGRPVDAVINPPHTLPALRHGSALHLLLEASHCYLANLLDAPAGVVPVGEVTAEDERAELAAGSGAWAVEDRLRRQNAAGSAGLPIGVQVMARPWRDDVALAVMSALESANG
ncbi:Acylamidase [Posidoniimonas corsicana]|uniref:Acylamidase n=1 Tax=Posidoniimonas corsicana TaxID=1938618 RepID=A0A5C5VKK0_9BACT|nr:amidase family protein [Posidoniimonas corsicana]TWT38242.1 Acylamidase [Posidoniimonas corsicana]